MRFRTAASRLSSTGICFAIAAVASVAVARAEAARPAQPPNAAMLDRLRVDGIEPARVMGFDDRGIPLVCGTASTAATARNLPAGTRGWETIPGVIRNDGLEAFRLEVDVNEPVAAVTLETPGDLGLVPPAPFPIQLRDDGLGADLVAGDFVFSAGLFHWNPAVPMLPQFRNDPDSPAGLQVSTLGLVTIEETGGTTSEFLVGPSVGVLRSDIGPVTRTMHAADVAASPHLINVATDLRATQGFLHIGDLSAMSVVTNRIYSVLPDSFDFLMFFSTDKIERLPRLAGDNFIAGIHNSVRVDYTGTGIFPYDFSAGYGSGGRLLSLNALDAYDRGLYAGNATHELLHQWSAFIDAGFGLKGDPAHWSGYSNIASLLGGFRWIEQGDGSFLLDCEQGRNGSVHASPVDKYMMGVLDGADVPTMRAYDENTTAPGFRCFADPPDPVLAEEVVAEVTVADIQAVHGERAPGPASAKRDFRIGFVAESHGRLLNATEFTFYDVLAEYYATPVAPAAPDPYVGFNWVPIDRYFGEGTSWTSDIVGATTTSTSTTSTSTSTSSTSSTSSTGSTMSTTTTTSGSTTTTSTTLAPAGVCADPTGDGMTTASDALQVLRSAVGAGACPACRCDVDGDGTIDATDALAVLRIAVGAGPDAERCPPCGVA